MHIGTLDKIIEHLRLIGNWEMDPYDDELCIWHELKTVFDWDFAEVIDVSGFVCYSGDPRLPIGGEEELELHPDLCKWSDGSRGKLRRKLCLYLADQIEQLNAFAFGAYDRGRNKDKNRFDEGTEYADDWRAGWQCEDDSRWKAL